MTAASRTWIVLVRDLSGVVHIAEQPDVVAALVLDADTGLIVGQSMDDTVHTVLAKAFETALTQPVGPLVAQAPGTVVCSPALAASVTSVMAGLAPAFDQTSVIEADPVAEAEEIFDSLVGHLSGRAQPFEPPDPGDWALLFAEVRRYCETEPWARWGDEEELLLELTVGDTVADFVAVVIGAAGIQRGLAVYPGTELPDFDAADALPPDGSLVAYLDRWDDVPSDLVEKAVRYGWPTSAPYAPICLGVGSGGFYDLDRLEAAQLTLAVAAVLALDAGGPMPLHGPGAMISAAMPSGPTRLAYRVSRRQPTPPH